MIKPNKQSNKADADQSIPPFEKFLKKTLISNYLRTKDLSKNRRTMDPAKKIMDIIDVTDELLNFDIDKVKIPEGVKHFNESSKILNDSRRFFQPPGRVLQLSNAQGNQDYYSLRARFYELMKQTMYEARDAMPIIQDLRRDYKWHSLYKMGFLFSKTDDQAKLFSQMSHKFYIACRTARQLRNTYEDRMNPVILNEFYERLLNHWLETDMLVDIIKVNDANARKTLHSMKDLKELDNWFIDEFADVYHVQKKIAAETAQRLQLKKLREEEEEKLKQREDAIRGYSQESEKHSSSPNT
ncbi:hypothetical protein O0L34_g2326 [Tuta absoluta]|nr:hypothetical protein O0L34_g2326 [Tuta absoluta]